MSTLEVTKLQRSFAYRLARLFPSGFVRWIDAVSAMLNDAWPNGIQSGEFTMTNGVSAAIPARISANTKFAFALRTVSGAFGTPAITLISQGDPGFFVVTSTLPATGATVATDQGTYHWIAVG